MPILGQPVEEYHADVNQPTSISLRIRPPRVSWQGSVPRRQFASRPSGGCATIEGTPGGSGEGRVVRYRRMTRLVVGTIAVLALASAALAQWPSRWDGFGRSRYPPQLRPAGHIDDGFSFCRLMYTSGRRGSGRWSTDYPLADINFMIPLLGDDVQPRQLRRRRRPRTTGSSRRPTTGCSPVRLLSPRRLGR